MNLMIILVLVLNINDTYLHETEKKHKLPLVVSGSIHRAEREIHRYGY